MMSLVDHTLLEVGHGPTVVTSIIGDHVLI